MSNTKCSMIEFNDLPDEMLVKILKNLNNVQVLLSVMNTNKRLDRIICDRSFTSRLSLWQNTSSDYIYSLDDLIVNRFCDEILPKIHHQIQWLDLEANSLRKILLAVQYPQLRGLSLYGIQICSLIQLIQGNSIIFSKKVFYDSKIMRSSY